MRDSPTMNREVWLTGLIGAAISREDMRGLHRPSLVEIMPSRFVNNAVLNEAQRRTDFPGGSSVRFFTKKTKYFR